MAAPAAAAGQPGGEDRYVVDSSGKKRLKGATLCIPVVTGTVAFYLGKKASGVGVLLLCGGGCTQPARHTKPCSRVVSPGSGLARAGGWSRC